ncbi:MAG: hypothetical protein ACHQEB_02750 [Chitinophagales bacterium]
MATMIFKRDNLKLGLILGLIGPIIGLVAVYLLKPEFNGLRFMEFFDLFINSNKLITSVGALSLLANVVLFTIYINTHRDNTAKGIFLITLIYGIAILVLKILN